MFRTILQTLRARPAPDPDRDLFTVLDIGTELVKVLVTKRMGKEVIVLGSGTCRQSVKDMAGGNVLDIEGVAQNCVEALKEAEYESGVAPSRVIVGLAGELVRSLVSRVDCVRTETEREISVEEMQNIVEKVQWKAFDRIREQMAETGLEETDVKLIHSAITRVDIDGFEVSNPVGFVGKRLDVTVFNVFAPLLQYRSVETVANLINRQLLLVACEPYAVAKCLGFDNGSDVSALFVDIGGGTTDIALVRGGSVQATAMFGIGGRAWTKQVSRTLDVPYLQAEALKKGSGKRILLGGKRLSRALAQATETWVEGLSISLAQLKEREPFPSKLFLCGGGSLLPVLQHTLSGPNWHKGLDFVSQPRATHLYPRDVVNVTDYTDRLHSPQDVTPMALANLALDLTVRETALSKMIRKASRLVER